MNKYTDIFFDFDDTLYDTHGNSTIALKELYQEAHLDQYYNNENKWVEAYWYANVLLWGKYAKGEISRDTLMVERFRMPLQQGSCKHPSNEYCLELSDRFLMLSSAKSGLVEGARQVLNYLRQKGYRLHLCSNGFHEVQYKKLANTQLTDYFQSVILSEDAGANKPSAQFFDYAFKVSKASPEATLMIGDNYTTDIEGAMNVGLDAMLFNRWDSSFAPPKTVTYIVNKLTDIVSIL